MGFKMKHLVSFIALLLLAGVASTQPGLPRKERAQQVTDIGSQIKEKAELAVGQFQDRAGGRLDYSEKSLASVEEMLEEAAQYAGQMPPQDINALAELLGSYILEVAYRSHGGRFYWHEQKNQPVLVVGEPKFHVAIMTFDKVRGRLGGDDGDNIPFFYEGFAAKVRSATPGTRALYI